MRERHSFRRPLAAWFASLMWLALGLGGCTANIPAGQCEFDVHCQSGEVCVDHYCRSPCRLDSDCPMSYRCRTGDASGASAGCVPTRSSLPCVRDSECGTGEACLRGECRAQCREDYDCRALNPFNRCMNGSCMLVCQPRLTDNCDRAVVNGCEVRIDRDAAHCGACGRACPGAPRAQGRCSEGACSIVCDRGWADCDSDAANGCEADLSRAETCGACGVRCAGARGLCAEMTDPSGETRYACVDRCAEPTPDRCGESCTRTATDVTNCGACGTACASGPRAEARCAAGACSIRCTDPRYADCDRAAANGCEADLETAASHCGACGRQCPAGPHATPACAAGACSLVCESGWADCDGNAANGCEAQLNTTANCGACGNACPSGQTCTAGACVPAGCPGARPMTCGGANVDLNESRTNCGGCGVDCGACGAACRQSRACLAGVCTSFATNAVTNTATPTTDVGNPGDPSATEFQDVCPQGYALTGLRAWAGTTPFPGFSSICSRILLNYTTCDGPTIRVGSTVAFMPNRGGTGFFEWPGSCAPGFVIAGFDGAANTSVQAVTLRCASIGAASSLPLSVVVGTPADYSFLGDATMGTPFGPQDCAPGTIAVGIRGWASDTDVQAIALICSSPTTYTGTSP